MGADVDRVFVHGFPGLYGGAGTELHHQIIAWLHMDLGVHLIPTNPGFREEPLYQEMVKRGVKIHQMNEWDVIESGDPVFGFCNSEFLEHLPEIHRRTRRTVFVNCMTWVFDKEEQRMAEGLIGMFLYQNREIMEKSEPILRSRNRGQEARFMTFRPYFEDSLFPFVDQRNDEFFGCGRISRQDAEKFAANTLHIYEYFVAPKPKKALFLGFDHRAREKIGKPFDWIRVATDQTVCTQQELYEHCEIILQPSDTTENWPRVGFEAMASGSVLIVDNRGGWRRLVEHGVTGWLCDHERDFIYYASKMAFEPGLRQEMAYNARQRGLEIGGLEASTGSWGGVFDEIAKMPE